MVFIRPLTYLLVSRFCIKGLFFRKKSTSSRSSGSVRRALGLVMVSFTESIAILNSLLRSCNKLLPTRSLLRHHNKFFINIQIESIHNRNSQRALQRNSIHFGTGYFYKKKNELMTKFQFFSMIFLF